MLRTAFPDQTWEVHDVLAEGDRGVMHSTWRGTHAGTFMGIPPTHRSVETHHTYLFRLAVGMT